MVLLEAIKKQEEQRLKSVVHEELASLNASYAKIGDKIRFIVRGDLTNEERDSFQTQAGYNPLGYSIDNHARKLIVDGEVITIWECYSSCD